MNLLRRWDLWLLVFSVVLFVGWPQLDLSAAGYWYQLDGGFASSQDRWVQFFYQIFKGIHVVVILSLIWLWIASRVWRAHAEKALRRRLMFLFVVLALGPGLLVNVVFKGEWGRARPSQVVEFGGDKLFSPAVLPAAQCEKNCSFVSGHASMGFFFIAFAWVFRDRRWFWAGVVIGGLVGLGRMAQGGHFLSDVVFAFWAVYWTAKLCARWLLGYWDIRPTPD